MILLAEEMIPAPTLPYTAIRSLRSNQRSRRMEGWSIGRSPIIVIEPKAPTMPERTFYRGGVLLKGTTNMWGAGWSATWPFANLEIMDNSIQLRVLWQRMAIPRDIIQSIHRRRFLWAVGIQIEHTSSELNPTIIFWPLRWHINRLMDTLHQRGYPVQP